jgi:hypothetical protein
VLLTAYKAAANMGNFLIFKFFQRNSEGTREFVGNVMDKFLS